jgi:hypothetical protein
MKSSQKIQTDINQINLAQIPKTAEERILELQTREPLPANTKENRPARREWFLKYGFDRHFDGVSG